MGTKGEELPNAKPPEQAIESPADAKTAWNTYYQKVYGEILDKLPLDERRTINTAAREGMVPRPRGAVRNMKERTKEVAQAVRRKAGHGLLSAVVLGNMVGGEVNIQEPPQQHVEIPSLSQTKDTGPEIPQAPTPTWTFKSNEDGTFSFTKDEPLKLNEVIQQIQENRKNVTHDRVVRVMNYLLNGRSSYGTGFILDDGYILTAAHVVDKKDPFRRLIIFSDGENFDFDIVSMDIEKDLALLRYKVPERKENKFEPTKIGTYQEGAPLTMITLDPEDAFYHRKSSQKTIIGKGDINHNNVVVRLYGQEYKDIDQKLSKINYDIDLADQKIGTLGRTGDPTTVDPFYEEYYKEVPKKYQEKSLSPLSREVGQPQISVPSGKGEKASVFMPASERNMPEAGMSGSSLFNEKGELIGIAGPAYEPHIGGEAYFVSFSGHSNLPKEVESKANVLGSQIDVLKQEKADLLDRAANIRNMQYPVPDYIDVYSQNIFFTSSQNILPFLESAIQKIQK